MTSENESHQNNSNLHYFIKQSFHVCVQSTNRYPTAWQLAHLSLFVLLD